MTETRAEVEHRSAEKIKVQMLGSPLNYMSTKGVQETLLEILPKWEGFIHQRRLENYDPNKLRADGVMLLSNMLESLVNNTTSDRSARQSVRHRLHRLILENLK
jgi:hypothetical protein